MSDRYSLRPKRPDNQLPPLVRRRANRLRNGARVLRAAMFLFVVSFVLASALFTPVFLLEAGRLEAATAGGLADIGRFAGHLEAVFLGALGLAAGIVCLSAGLLFRRGACRSAETGSPPVPARCFLKGRYAEMCGV